MVSVKSTLHNNKVRPDALAHRGGLYYYGVTQEGLKPSTFRTGI